MGLEKFSGRWEQVAAENIDNYLKAIGMNQFDNIYIVYFENR